MRLLVACLIALACAPTAAAEVVARDGTLLLDARRDGRDGLCLDIRGTSTCTNVPESTYDAVILATDGVFAAAVPGRAASVRLDGGERLPTVAADGWRERFVLIAGAPRRPRLLRLYDVRGTLIGVSIAANSDGITEDRRVLLRRGGSVVAVERELRVAPDPLEPDRVVGDVCLDAGDGSATCAAPTDSLPAVRHVALDCEGRPVGAVVGLARAARLRLVLGDGRRRTVRTRALPGPYAGLRAVAVPVGPGAAVRRAITPSGDRLELRSPPARRICAGLDNAWFALNEIPPRPAPAGAVVAAEAAGRRLVVADGVDRALCVDVGRLRTGYCAAPPADVSVAPIGVLDGLVVGLLPAGAAAVRLRGAEGLGEPLALADGPAYQGRFAGRVRFLFAVPPRGVRSATVLDAAGRPLAVVPVEVPREAGRLRRSVRPVPGTGLRLRNGCAVAPGDPVGVCDPSMPARVGVTCRGTLVYGLVPRRGGVVVVRSDGSRRPARTMRAGGRTVFVARVPRGLGVAELRLTGPRAVLYPGGGARPGGRVPRRLPVRTAPAREQCGYAGTFNPPEPITVIKG